MPQSFFIIFSHYYDGTPFSFHLWNPSAYSKVPWRLQKTHLPFQLSLGPATTLSLFSPWDVHCSSCHGVLRPHRGLCGSLHLHSTLSPLCALQLKITPLPVCLSKLCLT